MICAGCSHEAGPRARFCEACGAPLAPSAAAADSPTRSAQDSRARAYAALPALIAFLQREGRVSYRALAHVFNGDQAFLDAAREELTFKRLARDEDGQGLVSTAEPLPGLAATADRARAQPASPDAAATRPPAAAAPEDIGQAGRRQLTVMFCDLADSTVLAGRLDAEDLREVIRAYQATAAEVIQGFAGHIAQYLGDGLLVYLGWPEAHENDAARAVHAGLGIVEAIATTLNPRLLRDKGVQLAVRVGIHTGPVVVGAMGGDGRRESLATERRSTSRPAWKGWPPPTRWSSARRRAGSCTTPLPWRRWARRRSRAWRSRCRSTACGVLRKRTRPSPGR